MKITAVLSNSVVSQQADAPNICGVRRSRRRSPSPCHPLPVPVGVGGERFGDRHDHDDGPDLLGRTVAYTDALATVS